MEFTHSKRAKLKNASQDGNSSCDQSAYGDYSNRLRKAMVWWKQVEDENAKREAVLAQRAAHLEVLRAIRDTKTAE